jgi:hypothetical protein
LRLNFFISLLFLLHVIETPKDGIFKRYRMAAEALGILLVRAAQRELLNLMVESSGRDIGSYAYIDFLFPVMHFMQCFNTFDYRYIEWSNRQNRASIGCG